MIEIILLVLIVLGFIAIITASIQDLKKREVDNWISFSLIIFALGFRFFYSLFNESFNSMNLFYQGLIGLGIFFVIGNILYYGRVFAGGDAKLMIALGAVLPLSVLFKNNLNFYILFLILFLVMGSIYGLIWSFFLAIRNKKIFAKEFMKQFRNNKKLMNIIFIFSLVIMAIGLMFDKLIYYLGVIFFLLPYIYLYAKTIDEACMIKKVKISKLTEGDWLYKNIKIGRKMIKSKWEGVSRKEIETLKRKKNFVEIREGIPFVPVFFFTFLIWVWIYLGYSSWQPNFF